MASVYYLAAVKYDLTEQYTMLRTEDEFADIEALTKQLDNPRDYYIMSFVSNSYGDDKHPDGKDKFRHHVLVETLGLPTPQ